MNNNPYQSKDYPTLTSLIEITARDYVKLRQLMAERNETEKFRKWQLHKFIKLPNQTYITQNNTFNQSKFKN